MSATPRPTPGPAHILRAVPVKPCARCGRDFRADNSAWTLCTGCAWDEGAKARVAWRPQAEGKAQS